MGSVESLLRYSISSVVLKVGLCSPKKVLVQVVTLEAVVSKLQVLLRVIEEVEGPL